MNRLLFAVPLALATLATSLPAQVRLGPQGPYVESNSKAAPKSRRPPRPVRKVYRFHITPASEPTLPLQYSLLPPRAKLKSGNSVPFYYRAVLSLKDRKEWNNTKFWEETWPRWTEGPIDDLPKAEMRKFLSAFNSALDELKVAAYRDHTDWSWRLENLSGLESVYFLLPEVQEMRSFARLLNLKIRLQIAEGDFDKTVESMQLGYKVAIDVAEPPTLINDLVGVAIASIMTDQLRDMINQPSSPNMYWALSALPRPYIDMRPAIEYEMMLPVKIFPALKNPESAEHSAEEWARLISDGLMKAQLAESGFHKDNPRNKLLSRLAMTGLIMRSYGQAKKELISWGFDPARVERMPVGQVVVIHQSRTYQYMYQQMMKWSLLPYHEAREGSRQTQEQLKKDRYFGSFGRSREIIPLASLLLPAALQAHTASARVDAKIAALRVVEAVRMHAAANKGRLPSALDKITIVPIPQNPLTGKPFVYWVEDDKAILKVTSPDNRNLPSDWRRMEITVKRR